MEDHDDKLAELLDDWQRATDAGRPITADEACRDCPELLAEFRVLLRQLGRMEPILRGDADGLGELDAKVQGGRFTPTSYHAKGGLGLVYRADDTELKRVVALKFMQTLAGLDPNSRRRFVSEAEITGKLEHPGVVPVYGLGRDSQDRPYYAMRFIQGITLGEAIDKLHDPGSFRDEATRNVEFRRLLRAFVSVCQTIAYAHARGIVHRDLKPGNVMLGPYGETLVVDWGLARKFAKADPDETVVPGYDSVNLADDTADTSMTGRATGSPAFMSPEQARGERQSINPASDIYSLGSTLYVLLTGKKPFPGKTASQVIELVKGGTFPPPRSANPKVSRSLDAVCVKAMAFEPNARYESAGEFAADLDRWMADEPVKAFREPFAMRARRWVKRNRTLVSAAVSVLVVAVTLLTVLGVLLGAKNEQLASVNKTLDHRNVELKEQYRQLEDKNAALELSFAETEKGYDDLQRAMNTMFAELIQVVPNRDKKVIAAAVKGYESSLVRYVAANEKNPRFRSMVGSALLMIWQIQTTREARPEALASAGRAKSFFEAILANEPKNREARYGRALCEQAFAEVDLNKERYAAARVRLEELRREYEDLAADPTPIHLIEVSSDGTGGVYRDSPAVHMAQVTLKLIASANEEEKLERLRTRAPAAVGPPNAERRRWLEKALFLLSRGEPIPADAPGVTRELALRLENELLNDPEWVGNTPELRARFREKTDALIRDHGYLPDVILMQVQVMWRSVALAMREKRLGDAIKSCEEIVGVYKRLIEFTKDYDPFNIRDEAYGKLLRAAEEWHKLLREEVFEMRIGPKPDAARTKANGEALDNAGQLIMSALEYLSKCPPRNIIDTLEAAEVGLRCGRMLLQLDNGVGLPEAEKIFGWMVQMVKNVIDQKPENAQFQLLMYYTDCQLALAATMAMRGKPDKALEAEATDRHAKLLAKVPKDAGLVYMANAIHALHALEAVRREDYAAAIESYEAMFVTVDATVALSNPTAEFELTTLGLRSEIADLYARRGVQIFLKDPKKADEALRYVRNGLRELETVIAFKSRFEAPTKEHLAKIADLAKAAAGFKAELKAVEKEILEKK